jgi:hypothetical protein
MEAACNLSRSCVSLSSADAFLQVRDAECNRRTSIRPNSVDQVADGSFVVLPNLRLSTGAAPKACIRRQQGYLVGVMIKLVKNLRFLAQAGCLKAGR